MRGKILILTGLAVGYVLGARAGRERYEQIKRCGSKLWNDPRVQQQVDRVEDYAKDKAPEVVEFLADGAKKVARQVSGRAKQTASPASEAAKPAAKSGAKGAASGSTKTAAGGK